MCIFLSLFVFFMIRKNLFSLNNSLYFSINFGIIVFLICNIKVFNIILCISLFILYNLNKSFEFNNEMNLKKIFLLFKIISLKLL